MKIAINTRFLIKDKLEGIGWYTYEIVKRIVQKHPEHDFYLLFDRPFHKKFLFSKNVNPIILSPQARHPLLWSFWFEFTVKKFLEKNNIDLFFSPDGFLCLNTNIKTILTIHDINFEYFPKQLPYLTSKYYRFFTPKFAKKADHIITVSKTSKKDIMKKYEVRGEKISAIYNGANTKYKPLSKQEQIRVRNNYTNGTDYFYFVGSLHPRKNIKNLIQGFDIFCNNVISDCKLLIIGEKMWQNHNIKKTLNKLRCKERILFLGRKNMDEITKISGAAIALAFTPYMEGFGIPLAEAMYCHTPIITSNTSCLPEIAGNTAIYADPKNKESIADAFIKLYSDPNERNKLAMNCEKQKSRFSWDKAAKKIWQIIEKEL